MAAELTIFKIPSMFTVTTMLEIVGPMLDQREYRQCKIYLVSKCLQNRPLLSVCKRSTRVSTTPLTPVKTMTRIHAAQSFWARSIRGVTCSTFSQRCSTEMVGVSPTTISTVAGQLWRRGAMLPCPEGQALQLSMRIKQSSLTLARSGSQKSIEGWFRGYQWRSHVHRPTQRSVTCTVTQ